MSLFKKRKNLNIRQRRFSDDDGDAEGKETSATSNEDSNSNTTVPPKKEKKKSKDKFEGTKVSSVLSFGDDLEADDGIVFHERKSSLSYKLRKEMKKERKEKKRGEKEKLKPTEKDGDVEKGTGVTELDELGIRIINGREAEMLSKQSEDTEMEGEEEEDGSHQHIFKPRPKKEAQTLDPWKKILQSGQIPDANMIHAIIKQRQKAREQGSGFIPLDDTVRVEEAKGRLIREDDNDHSDDGEGRMDLSVNQQARDRKEREEAFNAAQGNASGESDHEGEWEKQQLLKAGATAKLVEGDSEGSQDQDSAAQLLGSSALPNLWGSDSLLPSSSAALPRPANYQAEGIIKRLQDSLSSLEEVHRRHKAEADAIVDELIVCKSTVAHCNAERQPLHSIFQFYQDIRGYVTDLRECLNEKVPQVERLEEQVYSLYRQRAQKIVQRRRQDVKDQNDEFSPFAGKGAIPDEYRTRRAAEREGRRTRRRRERERKGETNHHDGMSTDDEEPHSETNLMMSELERCGAEARKVFEDVEEDFSQLKRLMARLEEWREKDRPTYIDAYVSYNLPKVFGPYIRLQMLLWNPLGKDGDALEVERMKWYNLLLLYGADAEDTAQSFRQDPDRKLMSHLVEKVILLKLKDLLTCCWDPLSHVQTVRLVNLLRHYTSTYCSLGPNSKYLKELTHAIISKIRDAIDNDVFIPMFPKTVYENRNSGVSLFFQRQFWAAWKLLGSVLMWHNVLSDSVIHDLAIRSILNLYLLPALNLAAEINPTDSLEKCRNVINALPRAWVKNETTHAFLGRLEGFLVALAERLEPSSHAANMKEIHDLLKAIGAFNQCEIIANKYL